MTRKLSNDGWAGVVAGLIMIVIGLLGSFSATLKGMIVGAGVSAIIISLGFLTEEVEDPKEGKLEIEKKVVWMKFELEMSYEEYAGMVFFIFVILIVWMVVTHPKSSWLIFMGASKEDVYWILFFVIVISVFISFIVYGFNESQKK